MESQSSSSIPTSVKSSIDLASIIVQGTIQFLLLTAGYKVLPLCSLSLYHAPPLLQLHPLLSCPTPRVNAPHPPAVQTWNDFGWRIFKIFGADAQMKRVWETFLAFKVRASAAPPHRQHCALTILSHSAGIACVWPILWHASSLLPLLLAN